MTKAELEAELEETREVARIWYHWALELGHWHDRGVPAPDERWEAWRRVRESGLRNQHPWIKTAPKGWSG